MGSVGRGAVAVVKFIYGFIFGDDWTVAVAVILALFATRFLVVNNLPAWWLVPLVAIVMTGVSLRRMHPSQPQPAPSPGPAR
jgi:hypothetical protein